MGKLKSYIFKMYENEYWYGPVVNDGIKYPLKFNSKYEVDVYPNKSPNQVNTILLSNKGRYIWCDSGFVLKVYSGVIEILSEKSVPQLYEEGETLKEAFYMQQISFLSLMVKYHLRVFSLNHNIILGLNFYMIKERKKY